MTKQVKKQLLTMFIVVCAFNILSEYSFAQLSKLIRRAANVSDNIPLRVADDIPVGKIGRETAENATLIVQLKKIVGPLDIQTSKKLELAQTPALEDAVLLCCGAQKVKDSVRDVALRGTLLRKVDAEMLRAIGRYDDLVFETIRFDKALELNKLPSPPGVRALTLDDFGAFFRKTGDAGYNFWKNSVKPHWKLWLGSSALAAVLLAPEEYLDELGNVTEDGFRKIHSFGGELVVAALKGSVEGIIDVVEEGVDSIGEIVEETVDSVDKGLGVKARVADVVKKKIDLKRDAFFSSKRGMICLTFVGLAILFFFRKPIFFLWNLLKRIGLTTRTK